MTYISVSYANIKNQLYCTAKILADAMNMVAATASITVNYTIER